MSSVEERVDCDRQYKQAKYNHRHGIDDEGSRSDVLSRIEDGFSGILRIIMD